MNWLDLLLLILLGTAAVKGFFRGFIVEVCSLLGLVLGIWAGVHLNAQAAEWIGLDLDQEIISFLVVLAAVLVGMHVLGRALTKVIDVAQLSLPNKLAGVLFGGLRAAFVLSVIMNLALALAKHYERFAPSETTLKGSSLFEPLRAFAPAVLPALEDTKWLQRALDLVAKEVDEAD